MMYGSIMNALLLICFLLCGCQKIIHHHTPHQTDTIIASCNLPEKEIVTFIGYESEGFEHIMDVMNIIEKELDTLSPDKHIICSNYSNYFDDISIALKIANERGFETIGLTTNDSIIPSTCLDQLFMVNNPSDLSDIHLAITNKFVAIGGNQNVYDELICAQQKQIPINLYISEMNHNKAILSAKKSGLSKPEHYFGKANTLLFNQY